MTQIFYLEADDVWVLQLLEQRDLPDGSAGHALGLDLQPNLLQGHKLICYLVLGLVHNSVRSFTNLLYLLEVVHVVCHLIKLMFVTNFSKTIHEYLQKIYLLKYEFNSLDIFVAAK